MHATAPNLLNPIGPPLETRASPTPHNNPLSHVLKPNTVNHNSTPQALCLTNSP